MNPRQFVVFSRVLYAVDPIDFFTQKHLMRRQVETNPITMTFHRATQTFLTGLLCFLMLAPTWTSAEGTKQTTATATDRTHLLMNFSEYNDFGRYNGTVDQRLFIHIENPETEIVYFGFSEFYSLPHCHKMEAVGRGTFVLRIQVVM